jgi:imidazoleglycerol phosphate synthase glutamine amidotransferase subunit HisH
MALPIFQALAAMLSANQQQSNQQQADSAADQIGNKDQIRNARAERTAAQGMVLPNRGRIAAGITGIRGNGTTLQDQIYQQILSKYGGNRQNSTGGY